VKISFLTKNIKPATPLKDFVNKKLEKLEKICKDIMEAWIEFDEDKSQKSGEKKYRAEIQIKMRGGTIRAEETTDDIYAAINKLLPKLKKQIEKHKTRFRLPKRGRKI
jgi:putative sigma-54 modulation protein